MEKAELREADDVGGAAVDGGVPGEALEVVLQLRGLLLSLLLASLEIVEDAPRTDTLVVPTSDLAALNREVS